MPIPIFLSSFCLLASFPTGQTDRQTDRQQQRRPKFKFERNCREKVRVRLASEGLFSYSLMWLIDELGGSESEGGPVLFGIRIRIRVRTVFGCTTCYYYYVRLERRRKKRKGCYTLREGDIMQRLAMTDFYLFLGSFFQDNYIPDN
jgi:ribosomal protein S6E (S10)